MPFGLYSDPQEVVRLAEQVAMLRQYQAAGRTLEVAVDGASPAGDDTLPHAYAQAGATWWLEAIFGSRGSAEEMLARVSAGPPAP